MESGDDLCQARHRGHAKPPLARHAVVQLRLVEAAHAEHPFDRLPIPTESEDTGLSESYRDDLEIKLRRGARVDAELVQAGLAPLLQRRKIEKRVFDRPLELVGEGAGEKDDGGVGLDTLHGCRRRSVGLRPPHEIQHLRLEGIGLSHALTIARNCVPNGPQDLEGEARQHVRRVRPGPGGEAGHHRSRYQFPSCRRVGPEDQTRHEGQARAVLSWPYYYGIQPTGTYPDQPVIKEWYYDGATTGLLLNGLKLVPQPVAEPPRPAGDRTGLSQLRSLEPRTSSE